LGLRKEKGIANPGDPPVQLEPEFLIGKDAPTGAAIERVAPERLDSEGSGAQGDIGRRALAGADPGTLVPVLFPGAVEPARAGVDIGFGLGELMAADNGDAVGQARITRVHEACTRRLCQSSENSEIMIILT
jgi:hypothetical protein